MQRAASGFSIEVFMSPDTSLFLRSCSREEEGVASGVMMTLRNIGAVLGIAVFGTLAMGQTTGMWAGPDPALAQLVPGFRSAFLAGMVVCIIVAIISATITQQPSGKKGSEAGEGD